MSAPLAYVIDDDTAVRTAFASALHKVGFEVETGADGLQAQELVQKAVPQVIVLDMLMPVMDGMSFLRYLREHKKYDEVKVVVVSSFPTTPEFDGLNVAEFLTKQKNTPEQVAAQVAEVVGVQA